MNTFRKHPVRAWTALAFPTTAFLCATVVLSGCSTFSDAVGEDKVNYKSSSNGPNLEIPPDLTQLAPETRYGVPGSTVSAQSYATGQASPKLPTAALRVGDVRIERSGNQRWLVVNRPADQLWSPVRDFWKEAGFSLVLEQENLGILETDYAENRAKLPSDFIRNTLGKLVDGLYSTGERDKFRTRLERTANGSTEIYISHRGMVETALQSGNAANTAQTVWQPRPSDPELEAEFLRRLMVKLGVAQDQSKALLQAGAAPKTSRLVSLNNVPVVQIDEGFEYAWRRVGLALDRTGFTVEDRDRAKGLYFVRYVDPTSNPKEPGFFSKIFGGTAAAAEPLKYRIEVQAQGAASTNVTLLNAQGVAESSANAQRILTVIAEDLK